LETYEVLGVSRTVDASELGWKYGYLIIILLSVIVLMAEVRYCKKKKML
jgi:Mg2+ and Co2+ transporter CorA